MLIKSKALKGYKLKGLDGEIGKVREFYFDDLHWTIRYLVADTGGWLSNRQVLISPHALMDVSQEGQCIALNLTKKQIEGSPSLETDKPVSRQFEDSYNQYHRYPAYWGGANMLGYYPNLVLGPGIEREPRRSEKNWNPNLRSTHDVSGRHVEATDGGIGHVEDFMIDVEAWVIRYLIVDTSNFWFGKKVLVSPNWIESVDWEGSKILVRLSRESIKESPVYEEKSRFTRDYEIGLHRHYGLKGYWIPEAANEKTAHVRQPRRTLPKNQPNIIRKLY